MKDKIVYFHRGIKKGYSINKVTQTVIRDIPNKIEYFVPYSRASISEVLKNMLYIFKHRNKNGINHITGDIHYGIIPLMCCKTVLTVHDTVMIDYNEISGLKKFIAKWLWFKLPLMLATKIVCISEATKKSLANYTSRKDIIVIHDAIDPSFHYVEKSTTNECPNILIIGTKENKNVERTLTALTGINCKVTIIGKLSGTQLDVLSNNNIDYVNKCNLTDDEIFNEYCKADIISFVSLFEGFGMIIIEGNKVGRPVISSTIDVLKEVGGDSVYYVDPLDIRDINKGFTELINNVELRETLVKKGLKNVQRFEADYIRSKWLDVYKNIN